MMEADGVDGVRQAGGGRIFYLSKHFGYPLGGIRISHHHVALLRKRGFDARILLVEQPRENFFEHPGVLVEVLSDIRDWSSQDIIVVPEPWNAFIRRAAQTPARTFVFCQNHYNIFHGLGQAPDYRSMGVDDVFSCSEVISRFLEDLMGIDRVPVITNAIDHTLFKPLPKRRQIAVMPRKMKLEAAFIQGVFQRRHPRHAQVEWVRIEGVQESRVAEIMGQSQIFLSLGRNEGFGLPPVEAMASGCLVVGFVADGGREYADPSNGLWCDPEDYIAVVDRLAEALDGFDSGESRSIVDAARATAARFDLASMERDLVDFWTPRIAR
jgi:glycosyltransferase involved in cell wall biosynthesis